METNALLFATCEYQRLYEGKERSVGVAQSILDSLTFLPRETYQQFWINNHVHSQLEGTNLGWMK